MNTSAILRKRAMKRTETFHIVGESNQRKPLLPARSQTFSEGHIPKVPTVNRLRQVRFSPDIPRRNTSLRRSPSFSSSHFESGTTDSDSTESTPSVPRKGLPVSRSETFFGGEKVSVRFHPSTVTLGPEHEREYKPLPESPVTSEDDLLPVYVDSESSTITPPSVRRSQTFSGEKLVPAYIDSGIESSSTTPPCDRRATNLYKSNSFSTGSGKLFPVYFDSAKSSVISPSERSLTPCTSRAYDEEYYVPCYLDSDSGTITPPTARNVYADTKSNTSNEDPRHRTSIYMKTDLRRATHQRPLITERENPFSRSPFATGKVVPTNRAIPRKCTVNMSQSFNTGPIFVVNTDSACSSSSQQSVENEKLVARSKSFSNRAFPANHNHYRMAARNGPRKPTLSSHSFSGSVQNYPYNARWTWKPVARSRHIGTFHQPQSIVVRNSPLGSYPRQRYNMSQTVGRNEAYLRLLAHQLLSNEESEKFKDAIHSFRLTKSIPKLCSQLKPIINTVEKMILLVEISRRLPEHLKEDFHRLCSLQFDNYYEVVNTMNPGKQSKERTKIVAQDSSGAIRVIARGNQKTLVFNSTVDQERLNRNAASASETSFRVGTHTSHNSTLLRSDDSLGMFQNSMTSDNSDETFITSHNRTNNAIYSEARPYGDSKPAAASHASKLNDNYKIDSLDSSTASESLDNRHNSVYRHQERSRLLSGSSSAHPHPHPQLKVRHVNLSRTGRDSLGISIKGGKEHKTPVSIQDVEGGSQAERQGLKPGDILLDVNGYSFQDIFHVRAVEIIKSHHNLHLTITRPSVDDESENFHRHLGDPIPVHKVIEKDVMLMASKDGGLGFSLSGGADQAAEPLIADVFKNSPAEMSGLLKGDKLLQVLGIDTDELTHKQIVTLATSSKNLKLRIQRRILEEARNVHNGGTIYSGSKVSQAAANGIYSLSNGDGPQFASSPVVRRKSQSSMSIDDDDKENGTEERKMSNGHGNIVTKEHRTEIVNGHHSNHAHDAHNRKLIAAQAHGSVSAMSGRQSGYVAAAYETPQASLPITSQVMVEVVDKRNASDSSDSATLGRRKYVKRRDQMASPVHKHSGYSTFSYRNGGDPLASYDHRNGANTNTMERRSYHSSVGEVNKVPLSVSPRPFSSFIVVPGAASSTQRRDADVKMALKEGLEKRNKALQKLQYLSPSTNDSEWKI